jgi:hypothetical protein
MFNQLRVNALEDQLEQAKKDALPVIVEKVNETADEVVYENKTSGTQRVDLKGGEPVRYEAPGRKYVDLTAYMKDVPQEVGKVVSQDEAKRTVELVSGTQRVDQK